VANELILENNLVEDILPLVNNPVLSKGDIVDFTGNPHLIGDEWKSLAANFGFWAFANVYLERESWVVSLITYLC
jgi:hypothetical protein